jgi:hypothetical protein
MDDQLKKMDARNQLKKFIETWCDLDPHREFGLSFYVQPFHVFKREYQKFCQREGLPTAKCTYSYFMITLKSLMLTCVSVHPLKQSNELLRSEKLIIGLRLKP